MKWKDTWYMDLPLKWKLAWLWVLDNCDHAGIAEANPRLMAFQIGEPIDGDEFIRTMGGRVTKPKSGKWFVPNFIEFQYGQTLSMKNSAHRGVVKKLSEADIPCPVSVEKEGPTKALPRPYLGPQDMDTDKDTDKDLIEGGDGGNKPTQIPADLLLVPGFDTEWQHFIESRKAKKKPMTHHAEELILKRLSERPSEAVSALSACVEHCWMSFKWHWIDDQKRTNGKPRQTEADRDFAKTGLTELIELKNL